MHLQLLTTVCFDQTPSNIASHILIRIISHGTAGRLELLQPLLTTKKNKTNALLHCL